MTELLQMSESKMAAELFTSFFLFFFPQFSETFRHYYCFVRPVIVVFKSSKDGSLVLVVISSLFLSSTSTL